jgi:hypothetical protein
MIHEDIWMLRGQVYINNCRDAGVEGVVITDVRFNNEAEMIRNSGGIICHIVRPDGPEIRKHASEEGIIHQATDFHIRNNGTINELYGKVGKLIQCYNKLLKLRR